MEPRVNAFAIPFAAKAIKHLNGVAAAAAEAGVPASTRELVNLRASQINGCAFCVDMHTKDAAHAGETDQRLHLVAAWREAKVFTDAERAALALAEEGTRIADAAGGVPDDVWAEAAKHYSEEQLMALVLQIALINAYNRANVMIQMPAGDYRPGMKI